MNQYPDVDDRESWVEALQDMAKSHGATNVAICFDFGDNQVTYSADAPDGDDDE